MLGSQWSFPHVHSIAVGAGQPPLVLGDLAGRFEKHWLKGRLSPFSCGWKTGSERLDHALGSELGPQPLPCKFERTLSR